MKRRNGFTLVELMAVIVVLGLLMAIAIPSSLKMSSKVKDNAYNTKIDLIEEAGKNYGQSNVNAVKKGTDYAVTNRYYTCTLNYNGDKELTSISYNYQSAGYNESKSLGANEYWCTRLKVEDLVSTDNLAWDETNQCNTKCTTDAQKNSYDNIVVNTKTNNIINKCYVYVYYKYNRIYATFDKPGCSIISNSPTDGKEYKRIAAD